MKLITLKKLFQPFVLICIFFFIAYAILGVVRHNFYGSFGADLGFIDRQIWIYSTLDFTGFIGGNHFEPTSLLYAPFYWAWPDPRTLIILQAFAVAISGVPIFLLAKKKKLHSWICYVVLLSYLTFFGVQNALWFDVHTSAFGAAYLAWFIYFLDRKRLKLSILFFLLAIGSKENLAAYAFLLCLVHWWYTKSKYSLAFAASGFLYTVFLFKIYYPFILPHGYGYSSSTGLVSGGPLQMLDTDKKRETIFYTFAWVGFLPFLSPISTIPVLGNLASYFILGRDYVAAHEIFMHYRIDLAPLLSFATIFTIARYKWLNKKYTAVYLLLWFLALQYTLHLPLSYLSKQWFWTKPSGVNSLNAVIREIPEKSVVVAQNNIFPHLSERENISLIWPDRRTFKANSPCGQSDCPWVRWEVKSPEYMIVDLSPEWDIRHLLQNREEYITAIKGLEKAGVIKVVKQENSTILYEVLKPAK